MEKYKYLEVTSILTDKPANAQTFFFAAYLNLPEDARYELIQVLDVPDEEGAVVGMDGEEHVWTLVPLQDESF